MSESFDATSQPLRVLDADGADVKVNDENSAFNILFNTNGDSMKSMPVLAKQTSLSGGTTVAAGFKFSKPPQVFPAPPAYKKVTG